MLSFYAMSLISANDLAKCVVKVLMMYIPNVYLLSSLYLFIFYIINYLKQQELTKYVV